jgi:hypothetical protein
VIRSSSSIFCDVVIIGAGAAGLMCAIEAGKRGRAVVVLEKSDRPGKKILISGGGRCNFTNLHSTAAHFLSGNPDFCKSALARYTPHDFVRLVERHGISYHEKKLGRLFCDRSAVEILDMLLDECREAGVSIQTGVDVSELKASDRWAVTANGCVYMAESVVVACGGPSIPKMGATGFGYEIARQFGHTLVEPKPALVPLTWSETERAVFSPLSGVSTDCEVTANGVTFRENILFTHKGLSGPAILQASSYWDEGDAIEINFLPETDAIEWLESFSRRALPLARALQTVLPARLAEVWSGTYGLNKDLNHYRKEELRLVVGKLNGWKIHPAGTEGFDKAEVTRGGVDTRGLSSKTMESKKVPGLYFIGEVVDVTGHLGGHNFQWAWASGHAAGQAV